MQLRIITPLEIRRAYKQMSYTSPVATRRRCCKFVVKYRQDKRISCPATGSVVLTNPYGQEKIVSLPGRITIQYQYHDLNGKHRATLHNFGCVTTARQAQFLWEQAWVVLEREVLDFDVYQLKVISGFPRLPEYECVVENGKVVYKKCPNLDKHDLSRNYGVADHQIPDEQMLDEQVDGIRLDEGMLADAVLPDEPDGADDGYDLWQVEAKYGFDHKDVIASSCKWALWDLIDKSFDTLGFDQLKDADLIKVLVASILLEGGVPVSRIPQWLKDNFADVDQVAFGEKTYRRLVHKLGDNPACASKVFALAQAYSRSQDKQDAAQKSTSTAGSMSADGDVKKLQAVCVDATSISVDPNDYRATNLKNLVRQTGRHYGKAAALAAQLTSCGVDAPQLDTQLEMVLVSINKFSDSVASSRFLDEASVLVSGYKTAQQITKATCQVVSDAFRLVDKYIEQTCYRVNQEAGDDVFLLDGSALVFDFFDLPASQPWLFKMQGVIQQAVDVKAQFEQLYTDLCVFDVQLDSYYQQLKRRIDGKPARAGELTVLDPKVLRLTFGHEKQGRWIPMFQMLLATDVRGFPVAMHTFNGNDSESRTLPGFIDKHTRDNGMSSSTAHKQDVGLGDDAGLFPEHIVVADSGHNSVWVKRHLANRGVDYVMACNNYKLVDYFLATPRIASRVQGWELFLPDEKQLLEHAGDTEGLWQLICQVPVPHSDGLSFDFAATGDQPRQVFRFSVGRYNLDLQRICRKAIAAINADGQPGDETGSSFSFLEGARGVKRFKYDVFLDEMFHAGWQGVATSVPAGRADAGVLFQLRHKQYQVEECFRLLKVDFRASFLNSSTSTWIKGQSLLGFMALCVARVIEDAVGGVCTFRQVIGQLSNYVRFIDYQGRCLYLHPDDDQGLMLLHFLGLGYAAGITPGVRARIRLPVLRQPDRFSLDTDGLDVRVLTLDPLDSSWG